MLRNAWTLTYAMFLAMTLISSFVVKGETALASDETPPTTGREAMELQPEELMALEAKVSEGDARAAIRLARFYEFVKLDQDAAIAWYRKAAETGNLEAEYNVAIRLLMRSDAASRDEGAYLLEHAAKSGFPLAQTELERMRSRESHGDKNGGDQRLQAPKNESNSPW